MDAFSCHECRNKADYYQSQASPRDSRPEEVDPVILLRMSERDWLTVLSDLNSEKVTIIEKCKCNI